MYTAKKQFYNIAIYYVCSRNVGTAIPTRLKPFYTWQKKKKNLTAIASRSSSKHGIDAMANSRGKWMGFCNGVFSRNVILWRERVPAWVGWAGVGRGLALVGPPVHQSTPSPPPIWSYDYGHA